ncbi:hypothetical protein ACIOJG_37475 [Streptomyces anulatus]
MTAQPTGTDLVQTTARLSRAVAAGRATWAEAEELVDLASKIATLSAAAFRPSRKYNVDDDAPAAIAIRDAVGNLGTVTTAGALRAALAERPGMAPHDYLRSLRLATLPAWPLPTTDDTVIVVYRAGAPGFGGLWEAIGSRDDAAIDRAVSRTNELILGPTGLSTRGLGD